MISVTHTRPRFLSLCFYIFHFWRNMKHTPFCLFRHVWSGYTLNAAFQYIVPYIPLLLLLLPLSLFVRLYSPYYCCVDITICVDRGMDGGKLSSLFLWST